MDFLGRVLLWELIDPVDFRILIFLNSRHGFTGRHSLVTPEKVLMEKSRQNGRFGRRFVLGCYFKSPLARHRHFREKPTVRDVRL